MAPLNSCYFVGPDLFFLERNMGSKRLRILMVALSGGLCAAVLAPAFLLAHSCPLPAGIAYLFFSPLCHQIPERSFFFWGHPLAVCHRCCGIYLGLFLGLSLPFIRLISSGTSARLRLYVICIAAPITLDALAPYLGIWSSTPMSRFVTGLFFGAFCALLLWRGLNELFAEARWKPIIDHLLQIRGATS
jgi:uncharacterized membrane protein